MTLRIAPLVLMALAIPQAGIAAATAPKEPAKVKQALQLLAYVQADMAEKLPRKAYDRLPHESEEFLEAAPALWDAVAADSPDLKAKVEPLLSKAKSAAQAVADISKTHDEARITAAVASVDSALKDIEQLFPKELRPTHGQLGRRPGGQLPANSSGGPPSDIR